MKFIVDAQLPPALADWLHVRGHDAHHAVARVGATAPDEAIWRLAQDEHRAIITKDRDFHLGSRKTDGTPDRLATSRQRDDKEPDRVACAEVERD